MGIFYQILKPGSSIFVHMSSIYKDEQLNIINHQCMYEEINFYQKLVFVYTPSKMEVLSKSSHNDYVIVSNLGSFRSCGF